MNTKEVLKKYKEGDKNALAKLITIIENGEGADEILFGIYNKIGNARRIGFTGPSGVGKSTLIEKIVKKMREGNKTVAVVSVDPSSPFTGGAVLGDRIRMSSVFLDEGVFIRSMATRGSMGGLARATEEVCDLMDGFGFDYILIETIGVGQAEVDIMNTAHITAVVLSSGAGDEIQILKAGLMEIADIFIVNKSDKEGAENLESLIKYNLEFKEGEVPVLKTSALKNQGIQELVEEIEKTFTKYKNEERFQDKKREWIKSRIIRMTENEIRKTLKGENIQEKIREWTEKILANELSFPELCKLLLTFQRGQS